MCTGYAKPPGVRYFGLFLTCMGASGCVPGVLAYVRQSHFMLATSILSFLTALEQHRLTIEACCLNSCHHRHGWHWWHFRYDGLPPGRLPPIHSRHLGNHGLPIHDAHPPRCQHLLLYQMEQGSKRGQARSRGNTQLVLHDLTYDTTIYFHDFKQGFPVCMCTTCIILDYSRAFTVNTYDH